MLSIILMVMDKHLESFARIRSALTVPIAPLQYAVSWPARMIDNLQNAASSHEDLVNENVKLKSEQLLLRAQLQRLVALESENSYLKSLFQSSRQIKGKTLIAELIAVTSEPFINQVVIDKGSRDGVYQGQPVLDASGIMGQVMQVGPVTSRVLLINDPRSGISVTNVRTGMRAVAMGDSYTGKLKLMYVPKTADIQDTDMFITSGLGDHYPEGYPVGKVVAIDKDPGHQFASVTLDPTARLGRSRQVLLVWYERHA